ncbi:MAG: DUF2914 domain-containing protein [Calditrichaeota bacterium]|nr:MAG: DUF2914 domain-containing protein [Calditrichota bacterium]MBL1207771.1 DUF2914 domain-containing protein [Calditrichota bacterium]NOG47604.1 DUF2914 domain-containing protein [Calditrichota bacterium]
MKKLLFVFLLAPFFLLAQEKSTAEVTEVSICTAVEDRVPVGVDTSFTSDVERVYCYTKITGAAADSSVTHVWYHGDKEMARQKLSVKANAWRTWSSKRIVDSWTGAWRVDILSASGTVLKSKAFTVK